VPARSLRAPDNRFRRGSAVDARRPTWSTGRSRRRAPLLHRAVRPLRPGRHHPSRGAPSWHAPQHTTSIATVVEVPGAGSVVVV